MNTSYRNAHSDVQNIDLTVGERVHTLIWQRKTTNRKVAALLGIDASAIGKKLRAEQKFSIEQLAMIAYELDTSIAYLVGETEDPPPRKTNTVGPTGLEPMTSTVESGRFGILRPFVRRIA